MGHMKTTLDIPDDVIRKAKATAAIKGQSLKDFVTAAVKEKLSRKKPISIEEHGWRSVFGKVAHRHIREVDAVIRAECSAIDPEDWK